MVERRNVYLKRSNIQIIKKSVINIRGQKRKEESHSREYFVMEDRLRR